MLTFANPYARVTMSQNCFLYGKCLEMSRYIDLLQSWSGTRRMLKNAEVSRSIMGRITAAGSGKPGQGERIGSSCPPSSRTTVGPAASLPWPGPWVLRLAPALSWALSGAPGREDHRLRQQPGPGSGCPAPSKEDKNSVAFHDGIPGNPDQSVGVQHYSTFFREVVPKTDTPRFPLAPDK